MQNATCKGLSVILSVCPYPVAILFITPLEMTHPVAKWLKCVRCQLLPNGRDVTIKQGPSDLIQLAAHTHLTGQGLWDTKESEQIQNRRNTHQFVFQISCCPLLLPLTLCSSARERCMRTTSLLKRSSSWSSTTEVGEMSVPNFLRITSMSNNCGSLFWMSWATWLMYSSLLMLPPDSPIA